MSVMREIKKVLICGIGAIGSIYADKINRYDKENLRALVDKSRLEKYKKSPKIFNGKPLDLNYILPEEQGYEADLIIIATKADGLDDAIKNIKNFVGENTIIMSLLNGVFSEERIAEKYGWKHTLLSYQNESVMQLPDRRCPEDHDQVILLPLQIESSRI